MSRLVRALGCAAVALLASTAGLPTATAAQDGQLRLAHLSPDTPAVDVYLDSVSDPSARVTLPGVSYGTVSDYRSVPPGTYTVAMRAAGAAPTTPPVLSTTVQVDAGSARTVAGVGRFAELGLAVLVDDLTPPPPGRARVRVISATTAAPSVAVSVVGGPTLADGLALGKASGYSEVPAGPTSLSVTPAGGSATRIPVSPAANSVYTVLLLDQPGGGITVRPVLDAAGSGVMPAGGVETGAGGGDGGSGVATAARIVACLAVAGLVLTARPRRRRTSRAHGRRRA